MVYMRLSVWDSPLTKFNRAIGFSAFYLACKSRTDNII